MWGKGLPVCTGIGKEATEVARDSPEIVNFCLLPLDLYLERCDGKLLFKTLQLLPVSLMLH